MGLFRNALEPAFLQHKHAHRVAVRGTNAGGNEITQAGIAAFMVQVQSAAAAAAGEGDSMDAGGGGRCGLDAQRPAATISGGEQQGATPASLRDGSC